MTQSMTQAQKDIAIQPMETSEIFQRMITMILEAEDEEHKIQRFGKQLQEILRLDEEGAKKMEWGIRWAVEARKRRKDAEQRQNTEQEQGKKGKQVRFGEEEETKETQAESTDEQNVRVGRQRYRQAEEVLGSSKGEMKGVGRTRPGKAKERVTEERCEHEGKGGAGSKGRQQVENSVIDEDQGNTGAMRNEEEEEENHREDVSKLVEIKQKKEDAHEGQRDRMAPNMGAGGSHPQAMAVPETRETREMRWADCEDDERQEEEKREQETEKETTKDRARGTDERETTRFRAERRQRERRERKESAKGA